MNLVANNLQINAMIHNYLQINGKSLLFFTNNCNHDASFSQLFKNNLHIFVNYLNFWLGYLYPQLQLNKNQIFF